MDESELTEENLYTFKTEDIEKGLASIKPEKEGNNKPQMIGGASKRR